MTYSAIIFFLRNCKRARPGKSNTTTTRRRDKQVSCAECGWVLIACRLIAFAFFALRPAELNPEMPSVLLPNSVAGLRQ